MVDLDMAVELELSKGQVTSLTILPLLEYHILRRQALGEEALVKASSVGVQVVSKNFLERLVNLLNFPFLGLQASLLHYPN